MFMSRDAFDDDAPSTTVSTSVSQSTSYVPSSEAESAANAGDMTPAMRKAKMQEMREKALTRQKSKTTTGGMGMIRTAEIPKASSSSFTPTSPVKTMQPSAHPGGRSGSIDENASTAGSSGRLGHHDSETYSQHQEAQVFDIATILAENKADKEKFKNGEPSPLQRTGSANGGNAFGASKEAPGSPSAPPRDSPSSGSGKTLGSSASSHGLPSTFDPVKKATTLADLDLSDLKTFLTTPAPKGLVVQCCIQRNKKGLMNKMFPTYELYIEGIPGESKSERELNQKFLLASKKRSKNKTSNYLISMDRDNFEKDADPVMGKVRSNFVGTAFTAYNKGVNPKDLRGDPNSWDMNSIRDEIAAVFYEANVFGSKGPRKMTALIPAMKTPGQAIVWKPLKEADSIIEKFKKAKAIAFPDEEKREKEREAKAKAGATEAETAPSTYDPRQMKCTDEYLVLTNKTPKWHDQVGAYVLNFNGRVTMASVKNFQLISTEDQETVLLQFGRVGKDSFTMDFQWPITPLQAFSICLSSFDYKLACE